MASTMNYHGGLSLASGFESGSLSNFNGRNERRTNLLNTGQLARRIIDSVPFDPLQIGGTGSYGPTYGMSVKSGLELPGNSGSSSSSTNSGSNPSTFGAKFQMLSQASDSKMRVTDALHMPGSAFSENLLKGSKTTETFKNAGSLANQPKQDHLTLRDIYNTDILSYGKKQVPEVKIDKDTMNIEAQLRLLDQDLITTKQKQANRMGNLNGQLELAPFEKPLAGNIPNSSGIAPVLSRRGQINGLTPSPSKGTIIGENLGGIGSTLNGNQANSTLSLNPDFGKPGAAVSGLGLNKKNEGLAKQSKGPNNLMEKPNRSPMEEQKAAADNEEFGDPGQLVECPEGCGRKFNQEALEKHVKVCKKIFQEKRKKFDSKQKREVDEEQKELQKNNKRIQQTIDKKKKLGQPKWKKESEAFKNKVKGDKTDETAEKAEIVPDIIVKCTKCGKPFVEDALKSHFGVCKGIKNEKPKK